MTREEKQLLIKDLCARLPYGLKVKCEKYPFPVTVLYAGNIDEVKFVETGGIEHICLIKPYLRPMSSMTDEELMEFGRLKYQDNEVWEIVEMRVVKHDFLNIKCRNKHDGVSTWVFQIRRNEPLRSWMGIDWLNAHHFDYRIVPSTEKTLIKSGLALEAPGGMYKTE